MLQSQPLRHLNRNLKDFSRQACEHLKALAQVDLRYSQGTCAFWTWTFEFKVSKFNVWTGQRSTFTWANFSNVQLAKIEKLFICGLELWTNIPDAWYLDTWNVEFNIQHLSLQMLERLSQACICPYVPRWDSIIPAWGVHTHAVSMFSKPRSRCPTFEHELEPWKVHGCMLVWTFNVWSQLVAASCVCTWALSPSWQVVVLNLGTWNFAHVESKF